LLDQERRSDGAIHTAAEGDEDPCVELFPLHSPPYLLTHQPTNPPSRHLIAFSLTRFLADSPNIVARGAEAVKQIIQERSDGQP